jgi:hypothetical protein
MQLPSPIHWSHMITNDSMLATVFVTAVVVFACGGYMCALGPVGTWLARILATCLFILSFVLLVLRLIGK